MATQSLTVAELIRVHMDALRPAERKVARSLLANYPAAGLTTAAELADAASVSAPTVVRFATRLGIDGYSELQARLLAELEARQASPVSRIAADAPHGRPANVVQRECRHRADLIAASIAAIPAPELESAIAILADPRRTVLLTGGYFSHLVARYFSIQLSQIRPHVHFVAEPAHHDLGYLLEAGKRHVLVCFDIRRYEPEALSAVREAHRRHATTIVVTDEWLSPAAQHADVVLPVAVRAEPFDSLTAVVTLAESLIAALTSTMGARALSRMRSWEESDTRRQHSLPSAKA